VGIAEDRLKKITSASSERSSLQSPNGRRGQGTRTGILCTESNTKTRRAVKRFPCCRTKQEPWISSDGLAGQAHRCSTNILCSGLGPRPQCAVIPCVPPLSSQGAPGWIGGGRTCPVPTAQPNLGPELCCKQLALGGRKRISQSKACLLRKERTAKQVLLLLTRCADVCVGHSDCKAGSNTLPTPGPEGCSGGAVLLPETCSDGRDYCRSAVK